MHLIRLKNQCSKRAKCHSGEEGGGEGQKNAKKVSRIIINGPKHTGMNIG
jgi:hypothetical protein